jgi:GR25 family glycosyltransferase involved in LPS biosynthesis
MYFHLCLIVVLSISFLSAGELDTTQESGPPSKNSDFLDILWINLDRSSERRHFMNNVYNFYGLPNARRFSALTPADLTIPPGFEKSSHCKFLLANETVQEMDRLKYFQRNHQMNRTVLVSSHCSTGQNFEARLLATTLSHLLAMYQAVHHVRKNAASAANKKYALIMEDDLTMAFDIDFEKLIASAPSDFTMLQLVTSHPQLVDDHWEAYKTKGQHWIKRDDNDNWCTGAYIINKERLKPIITKLIRKASDKIYLAHVIALGRDVCSSSGSKKRLSCCKPLSKLQEQRKEIVPPQLPCVLSPEGYEADSFIYNMDWDKTYVANVPLFLTSEVAAKSTLHQDQVSGHNDAFGKMRNFINHMLFTDKKLIPHYVNPAKSVLAATAGSPMTDLRI